VSWWLHRTIQRTHIVQPFLSVSPEQVGTRRRPVPLFVVRRAGAVPGPAAVSVSYDGELFYIPKPALGSVDEARSLQELDFVNQVITMVTTKTDLPESNTATLVLAH
jgi:hypothetical protein